MNTSEQGQFLGYPKCCIDSFEHDKLTGALMTREPRKCHGTGYIPCAACNAAHTEEQLVANISKARQADIPFPKFYFSVHYKGN